MHCQPHVFDACAVSSAMLASSVEIGAIAGLAVGIPGAGAVGGLAGGASACCFTYRAVASPELHNSHYRAICMVAGCAFTTIGATYGVLDSLGIASCIIGRFVTCESIVGLNEAICCLLLFRIAERGLPAIPPEPPVALPPIHQPSAPQEITERYANLLLQAGEYFDADEAERPALLQTYPSELQAILGSAPNFPAAARSIQISWGEAASNVNS
ncbi:MAG: hypothetical protein KGI80_00125 [Verrucomicrobiota bacterium]|nr:hypothetical protein [Verrucomicrobiota bacterium]